MISSKEITVRWARIDALIETITALEAFLDPFFMDTEDKVSTQAAVNRETNPSASSKEEAEIAEMVSIRIRKVRSAKGLRQQDLADLTGIARPNIARLESGRRMPKIGTLKKIAEALQIRIEDLMA